MDTQPNPAPADTITVLGIEFILSADHTLIHRHDPEVAEWTAEPLPWGKLTLTEWDESRVSRCWMATVSCSSSSVIVSEFGCTPEEALRGLAPLLAEAAAGATGAQLAIMRAANDAAEAA